MLLFQKRFFEGLQDGSITLTFRRWNKAKVKPGGRYRSHPIGVVEVDAIDRVILGSISAQDARRAGFEDLKSLLEYIGEREDEALRPEAELFRVALRYVGDGDRVPIALVTDLSDLEVADISKRLAGFDARSENGPWTAKALDLIGKQPRTAASKLARQIGWETAPFKANVVKLKKLGLTQSFEVGYEISPRGQTYLSRVAKDEKKKKRRKGTTSKS